MQAPRLRRGLFGHTGRSVRLVLADRDRQLMRAEEHVRSAEAWASELASEARALLEDLTDRTSRLLEAEGAGTRREELLDLLRRELAAARREFLGELERARSAETAVERLLAELTSTRSDLELARRPAWLEPSRPLIVLPDLEADGAPDGRRVVPR